MIEYLEIRNTSRNIIGIIDTPQSIIWNSLYKSVGDFEIYIRATEANLSMLKVGHYVTRRDVDDVGIIEEVSVTFSLKKGRMIIASGRFAKSILDRRHIYNLNGNTNNPTILNGNVEKAVRSLVESNAIKCNFDYGRNIGILELGALSNLSANIVDELGNPTQKQVSYANLLDYSDSVLEEYDMSSKIILSDEGKLQYIIYKGADRSVDNIDGNEPIIFSQEFDNLLSSNYTFSRKKEKNTALIGGQGEGLDRFYSILIKDVGLDRKEMFVNASSISKTYKDSNDEEKEYSSEEYEKLLISQGRQELATKRKIETFSGGINITDGQYVLNRDFFLGDIVTIQDNELGKYINARVIETMEAQDENGYSVSVEYE